jgi:methylated-DNA-[protein]-cysteine S-methyltransferase
MKSLEAPQDSITLMSKLAPLRLEWSELGVTGLSILKRSGISAKEAKAAPMWLLDAAGKLLKHLSGDAQDLSKIPLDLSALTPFQKKVAEILRGTKAGQTISYGEIAWLAGKPGAARAVGQAVARNPILILIPCHRVVASDGPGGWSALGSLAIKQRLMELEREKN